MKIELLDLTQEMTTKTLVFKGHAKTEVDYIKNIERDGKNVELLKLGTHTGTHIDTPLHFFSNSNFKVNDINKEVYILDFTNKCMHDKITTQDLIEHEIYLSKYKHIIIKTGWDIYFNSEKYYDNYPCFSINAINHIISKNIRMIGMDTPSPGPIGEEGDLIHKKLLNNNVIILESLCNLTTIKEKINNLLVFPLKFNNLGGIPCRALIYKINKE